MRNVVCKLLNAADKLPNSCLCQHLHRKPHSSTSFARPGFQAPIPKPGRCLGHAGQPARGCQREHHQAAAAAAASKTYHTISVANILGRSMLSSWGGLENTHMKHLAWRGLRGHNKQAPLHKKMHASKNMSR